MATFYRKFLAIVIIAVCWILLALNVFYELSMNISIITFMVLFVLSLLTTLFNNLSKEEKFSLKKIFERRNIILYYGKFGYILIISEYLLFIFSISILVTLFIYGGGPKIVDGNYCIVNHGRIVQIISNKEYIILSILEKQLFICGPASGYSGITLQLCNKKNFLPLYKDKLNRI